MLSIVAAVRDFLIAMALSWVGITMQDTRVEPDQCSGQACDSQNQR